METCSASLLLLLLLSSLLLLINTTIIIINDHSEKKQKNIAGIKKYFFLSQSFNYCPCGFPISIFFLSFWVFFPFFLSFCNEIFSISSILMFIEFGKSFKHSQEFSVNYVKFQHEFHIWSFVLLVWVFVFILSVFLLFCEWCQCKKEKKKCFPSPF